MSLWLPPNKYRVNHKYLVILEELHVVHTPELCLELYYYSQFEDFS